MGEAALDAFVWLPPDTPRPLLCWQEIYPSPLLLTSAKGEFGGDSESLEGPGGGGALLPLTFPIEDLQVSSSLSCLQLTRGRLQKVLGARGLVTKFKERTGVPRRQGVG